MSKAKARRERWTRACNEEISRPKKPNHLAVVVEHLGPFAYETKAKAIEKKVYVELNQKRLGLSRELATELVEDSAQRFNAETHLARGAPRFKNVQENLESIRRSAVAFAAQLESLDDITRYELQRAGTTKERQKRFAALMTAADTPKLPRASIEGADRSATWVDRLESLARYAEVVRENLAEGRNRQNYPLKDVGGNTNLWMEANGPPRWGLVTEALEIYEMFKPGEATGTEFGPIHQFVLDLFEYATGREGTTEAKVESWLKKLVRPDRKDREAKAETLRLARVWDEIIDKDPELRKKSSLTRITEIIAAQRKIASERRELWRITWPHVRLLPEGV